LPEIYFALAKTGIVGIPLNYRLAPAEIVTLMRSIGAKALIYSTRFAACAEAVRAQLAAVETYVGIGEGAPEWAQAYEDVLAAASPEEPEVDVQESDPYYFNLTSGTTGLPKCYLLTHYNNAILAPMFDAFEVTTRDVFFTVFPAFGRVGFAWIGAGVMFGVRNVLTDFHPGELLGLIETEKVTIGNLVPTMAAMMLAEPSLPTRDLSSLRGLVFAGASFPEPLRLRVAAELCPAVYEYYGMQETGTLTLSTPEDRKLHPHSVGAPLCFAEVHVERPDGSNAAPEEIGEIVGRSVATCTSYFDNPARTAETFRGGFVHTGDLGMMNEDGFLFIKGRLKDMIVTGGQNVYAAEVEEILMTAPGVADCAVFGLQDETWGERVAALIVVRPGAAAPSAEDIVAHCREQLAGFKLPRAIHFQTEALPRTPTGKVQKFLLVERFARPVS
jgi:fatty-acyl-CoA synthase